MMRPGQPRGQRLRADLMGQRQQIDDEGFERSLSHVQCLDGLGMRAFSRVGHFNFSVGVVTAPMGRRPAGGVQCVGGTVHA